MDKMIKFWGPPLLWMLLMFPLANSRIAGSLIYEWCLAVFNWVFPHGSDQAFGTMYIIFRKSFHFIEYAVLCYLLWRGFKGTCGDPWAIRWIILAAIISIVYGMADEFFQTMVPTRRGSVVDVLFDVAGIFVISGLVFYRRRQVLSQSN